MKKIALITASLALLAAPAFAEDAKTTGTAPADLRRLSSHLEKIEDTATDPRASHIHRKRLIDDADPDDSDS